MIVGKEVRVSGRQVSNWVLSNHVVKLRTGFNWQRLGSSDGFL